MTRVVVGIATLMLSGGVWASDCTLALLGGDLPPIVEQETDYSCGPGAAFSWLQWEQPLTTPSVETLTEEKLIHIFKTTPERGTTSRNFVAGLRALGLEASYEKELGLKTVRQLLSTRHGVIVNIQLEGEGHWALLAKLTSTHAILMDPWKAKKRGYRIITLNRLYKVWYSEEGRRNTIVIKPARVN